MKKSIVTYGCMLYEGKDSDRKATNLYDHVERKKAGNHKDDLPNQKMHYFSLTPRLQRLYASKAMAKHTWWHKEHDKRKA